MPLANHEITNLKDFNVVTGLGAEKNKNRMISALYFYYLMDCLVEISYQVSIDFFKRPHLYTNLGDNPKSKRDDDRPFYFSLAELHGRYGCHEMFPSKEQRYTIYQHLFGDYSGQAKKPNPGFNKYIKGLIKAAEAFSERIFDTGEDMLADRVKKFHRSPKEYLEGLIGDSVRWSRENALASITEDYAYKILKNRGVASVFGIMEPPKHNWPYTEDANGDKLVEAISVQLNWVNDYGLHLNREYFSDLQRAALRGTEALATIVDYKESIEKEELKTLITKVYTWGESWKQIKIEEREDERELEIEP